jgi:hypothetical protein
MTMTDSNPKDGKDFVPPPPRKARGLQSPPPQPNQVIDAAPNLATPNAGAQDMNFKMDPAFHRAFKATASMRNMAMKELLEASFRCWIEENGNEVEKALLPPKSQG